MDTLLTKSRLTILQSVQALTETQDFLQFIRGDGVWILSLKLKQLSISIQNEQSKVVVSLFYKNAEYP